MDQILEERTFKKVLVVPEVYRNLYGTAGADFKQDLLV